MHLLNDMLTLLPSTGVGATTDVTSPIAVTSPAMNCIPTHPFAGFTFSSIPASLGVAASLNGLTLATIPTSYSGMAYNGVPANGLTLGTLPANGCPVNVNGLPICGTPISNMQTPPCSIQTPSLNGMTSAEIYGIAPPGMTSSATTSTPASDSASSSGGTSPAPLSPAQSMELVWHGEFDRLFAQYFPHMWCLVPTFYPPGDKWRTFKDSAKVRFSCQDCGHGWTSMKGRVVFWFELNYATNAGCVMFKLYGQQCQRCKTGKFEHAMWYPEEVIKVIGNVYNRVGQIYYGFVRPPLRIDRRIGKPRNQHNAELCQACKEGLCREEWSFT